MASAQASTSSASFVRLLRKSKFAAFDPSIEQVYSSHGPALARADFGLKRPLPKSQIQAAPFVRVNELDGERQRTDFRKATRETTFARKWEQAGIHMSPNTSPVSPPHIADNKKFGTQSAYVPASLECGGTDDLLSVATEYADNVNQPVPVNVFALSEAQFDNYVAWLRTEQGSYADYLSNEAAREAVTAYGALEEAPALVDLYEHAQKVGNIQVEESIRRFLALAVEGRRIELGGAGEEEQHDVVVSHMHPLLGLQYNQPTELEAHLADPIPGRVLQVNPKSTTEHRSTVLGLVVRTGRLSGPPNGRGLAATSFFPDGAGHRTNEPGRALFKFGASVTEGITDLAGNAIANASWRDHAEFTMPSHDEPRTLSQLPLRIQGSEINSDSMHLQVVNPTRPGLHLHQLGSQAYHVAKAAPAMSPSGQALADAAPFAPAVGFTEMFKPSNRRRDRRFRTPPSLDILQRLK